MPLAFTWKSPTAAHVVAAASENAHL